MTKSKQPIKQTNNAANMQNRNIGTKGQNKQVAQNQGNIGTQKNPNRAPKK